jgi:hypothetical protein
MLVDCPKGQHLKKYRSELDAEDVARATQQFGEALLDCEIWAQEIAHKYRIITGQPNIWDQAF